MQSSQTPPIDRPGAPAGLRRVALLSLFAFGCATVRVPASTIAETVPVRGGVPEPQLELWIESGGQVSPAESAAASAQAKAALESALAGLGAPLQGDSLLVVRAQGVARTASRRADQRAAIAGIVVGAVVVVAAVVVVLVASKGKGGGSGGKVARAAPAPRPAAVRPAPVPRVPVPVFVHVPRHSPRIGVDVYAGVEVPAPAPVTTAYYAPAQPPERLPAQAPAAVWPPGEELAAVSLPPPSPLDVDRRGFFDKDTLRLELVVVDRRAGTPQWTKVVEARVDPRDAQAVEQVLRDAVADGGGWVPAGTAYPPAAMR